MPGSWVRVPPLLLQKPLGHIALAASSLLVTHRIQILGRIVGRNALIFLRCGHRFGPCPIVGSREPRAVVFEHRALVRTELFRDDPNGTARLQQSRGEVVTRLAEWELARQLESLLLNVAVRVFSAVADGLPVPIADRPAIPLFWEYPPSQHRCDV